MNKYEFLFSLYEFLYYQIRFNSNVVQKYSLKCSLKLDIKRITIKIQIRIKTAIKVFVTYVTQLKNW
jgi:hypothetical protein